MIRRYFWHARNIINYLKNTKQDKVAQQAIKEHEYLLNEKQSTLDNYVQYLNTACELAKVDKVQVIEIVRNKNKKNNNESITNLLD